MQTFELLFLMLSAAAELRRWQCHATGLLPYRSYHFIETSDHIGRHLGISAFLELSLIHISEPTRLA